VAGRPQKPQDELAFKRGGRGQPAEVVDVVNIDAARPKLQRPEGLDPRAEHIWDTHIGVAQARLQVTDHAHVYRWIWNWHQWFREADKYELEGGVTAGRKGEPTTNPRLRALAKHEASIAAAEKQLGFTPLERIRQNIKYVEEQSALDKLRKSRPAGPTQLRPGAAKTSS
jgi:phage terminase small subunit